MSYLISFSDSDDFNVLMVVGGYPYKAHRDVELLDLSGQGRKCRKPQEYPGAKSHAVGAFVDSQ